MKYLLVVLTIAFAVLTGCNDPGASGEPNADPVANETFDDTPMITVDVVKSGMADDARPTSGEQLKTAFTAKLKTDSEQAFVDFVDWDSVAEAKRKQKLGGLLSFTYSSGRKKKYELSNSRLYPIAEYCDLIDCSVEEYNEERAIPITHVIELEFATDYGSTTGTIDVGEREGRYYLYPEAD